MNIIGFLKYVLPKYASDFEDSKLFMQNIAYYKDDDIKDKLIKDTDEGVVYHEKDPNNHVILFQVVGQDEIHQLEGLKSLRHSKSLSDIETIKIYCLTIITSEDVEPAEDGQYKLKDSYIDSLPNYSEKRVIYVSFNPKPFIETIKKNLIEEEFICCKMQPVEYFENEHPLFNSFKDIDHALDTVLYKSNLYYSQREYRIAIQGYVKQNIFYNNYSDFWNKIDALENIRIIRQ